MEGGILNVIISLSILETSDFYAFMYRRKGRTGGVMRKGFRKVEIILGKTVK